MKRIAVLSVHSCPLAALGGKETGGMNVYVRELSRQMGRMGIEVDVFTRSQNPHIFPIVPLGQNARVIHIKAGPEEPVAKHRLLQYMPEFTSEVVRFARKNGAPYDLVHSHSWLSGWVGGRLKKLRSVPLVHMFHTLGVLKNTAGAGGREIEPSKRLRVEREIGEYADCIVAPSPWEKKKMVLLNGTPPSRVKVIPCGVDLRLFHPIPPSRAMRFLGLTRSDAGHWLALPRLIEHLHARAPGDWLQDAYAGLPANQISARSVIAQLPRRPQGPSAYLKIADGCRRPCAFCSIPRIKGTAVSRPTEAIVREAQVLAQRGVRELILIAQDLTDYGHDLGLKDGLPTLLESICDTAPGLKWIRLMYQYPGAVSDRLIEVMATRPQIVHYVDIPLQHIHENMLERMRRESSRQHIVELLGRLRARIPGLALRTTFIGIGFPGETEAGNNNKN